MPEAPTSPAVPGFEVRRELGRGAMGVVYLAHERALGRDVALKVLKTRVTEDEAVRGRFEREVRAAARLEHPGIVPILSTGEANGHLWCAMAYVPGCTLDDILHAEHGPDRERIHPARAARIAAAVAEALDAAHAEGVTHRDVKPGNVMLVERSVPKVERASQARRMQKSWTPGVGRLPRYEEAMLADFGLALDNTASKLSVSGMLIGTPGYMAPEQFAGERGDVGPAADQWALGVVLYECLTGRLPFPSDDLPSLARFVMEAEPVA
ncbi:MAG: serine/threonine-protein kinase, partial [Planctomycetota bacterium]|nr:serine/threonine-protein kinase [Planctomycetota bacterium]